MTRLRLTTALAGLVVAGAMTTAPLAQEIRVTDSAGVEVVLPAPAERVAALGNATFLVAFVAGNIDLLVGTGTSTAFNHLLGNIFPDGKLLPEIGGLPPHPPHPETLAALTPDVTLMWSGPGAASHDPAPLLNAGLDVARYSSGPEEEMAAAIRLIGSLIGEPERAKLMVEWRAQMLRAIAEHTDVVAEEDRVRALGVAPFSGSFLVYGGGPDDPSGNYVYRAGGVNVAANGADLMPATVEQIAAWNPDVIFVWTKPEWDIDNGAILNDPVLSLTDAARNNRVHVIPTGMGTWGVTGPEDPFYWRWLAELMYPEIMPATLRTDLRDTYKMFFDYDLSDEEIDTILRMDVNATSADYDRFAR